MLSQFEGIIIGALAFLTIGFFHPLIIKGEYSFSCKIWPFFLVAGLVFLGFSFAVRHTILSACLGIIGFTSLWSIIELFKQKERVEKGWFPLNPKRKRF
jgi:uncharacterized membrane protein YuzA (DUF378 family)